MAFPKKDSRKIVVHTVCYRWMIGPNDGYNTFYAQKEYGNGQKIVVHFKTDIHTYWINFPDVKKQNLLILTPKDASDIILQALEMGWNPHEKSPPIVFDWMNKELIKRPVATRQSH